MLHFLAQCNLFYAFPFKNEMMCSKFIEKNIETRQMSLLHDSLHLLGKKTTHNAFWSTYIRKTTSSSLKLDHVSSIYKLTHCLKYNLERNRQRSLQYTPFQNGDLREIKSINPTFITLRGGQFITPNIFLPLLLLRPRE